MICNVCLQLIAAFLSHLWALSFFKMWILKALNIPYLLLNISAASNFWYALASWSQRQGHTVTVRRVRMPKDSQPTWLPQCLILTEVNGNAESTQTGVSVLQVLQCFCVNFVFCQSLHLPAQIKHSQGTPQSCRGGSSPAFPHPDT